MTSIEIARLELCRLEDANNRLFLYEEFAESGNELTKKVAGTKIVRGQVRRIDLDGIDSKRSMHKRVCWCSNSDQISKDLAVWNARMPCRAREYERDPVEAKIDSGSCEG